MKVHFEDIGQDPQKFDATYENAQARERTQVLMDYAGIHKGIVVGTGDLSELALGWCTYNGDHMSMYGVNGTVPKTLIRWIIEAVADLPGFAPAKDVLMDAGIVVRISEVLAIAMDDAPGGAVGILHLLSEAGLNIEYMYACVGRQSGKAIMVVRTDDIDLAEDILHRGGYGDVSPADVYRL